MLEVGCHIRQNDGIHKIYAINDKKSKWKYLIDKDEDGWCRQTCDENIIEHSKEDIKLNVGQEKLSIKASLIMEDEIRYIDNNMETIVNTITKQIISDKDLAIAQYIIQKLQKENKIYRKQLNDAFDKGFIHRDKIKEIVEELKAEYIKELEKNSIQAFILKCKIEVLKELLKDGGK